MHLVGLVMARFLLHNIRYDIKGHTGVETGMSQFLIRKQVIFLTVPGLSMGPMISDILMDTEFSLLCLSFMNINLLGIRKNRFRISIIFNAICIWFAKMIRLFLGKKFNLRHVTTKIEINSGDFTHLYIR